MFGSPIASTTYGDVTSSPSMRIPPTPSANEVCATTRTVPLNWIASAPAVRSSWTRSTMLSTSTGPSCSVIVTRMPGPVTGTSPAITDSVSASCWDCARAASRAPVLDCRSSRVCCSRVISD